MKKRMLLSALVVSAFLLAACGGATRRLEAEVTPTTSQAEMTPRRAPNVPDGDLTLQAFAKDRSVAPASDEVFDFALVNHTGDDTPVVVSLEHIAGDRWRTSLCVQLQCILGDGLERSVSDPFVLPPFLEQPFQVHVFVDETAQTGQATTLQVRVEPQSQDVTPQSVTLYAQVGEP